MKFFLVLTIFLVQLFAWFTFSSFLVIHGALVNELDDSTTSSLPKSNGRSQGDLGFAWLLKVKDTSFQSDPSLIGPTGVGFHFANTGRLLQAACVLLRRRLTCRADFAPGQSFRSDKLCQQMAQNVSDCWQCDGGR